MAGFKLDLTQSRTIPNCVAELRITDSELKSPDDYSEEKGPGASGKYPYILWELTLTETEHAGEVISHMTSLSPRALFGIKALTIAAGHTWPDEDSMDSFEFDPKDLYGESILGEIITEEYQGVKRNKIKKMYPVTAKEEIEEKSERRGGRGRRD